ncbi:MAG: ABC transporter permease [Candidatus Delongbacteria bacterium]|jgi:phospholipid/cholesterol/gamma-HCH transport system permease protein|nr:ABC transporter permease [Candidatus Delongbacteria bacterium]
MYKINNNTFNFEKSFFIDDIESLLSDLNKLGQDHSKITINFSNTENYDNAAIALINSFAKKKYHILLSEKMKEDLVKFNSSIMFDESEKHTLTGFENIVSNIYSFLHQIKTFITLSADVFYYSIRSIFNKSGRRKGSIYEQILLIGNNAVPIVFLLAFLIGFILSLQSAAQLRQFGANIYLVDLIVISMITEMGPMITAIIVAGRSGSAIAAEISTMQITEELDALKVMALNPLKYVVSPKMIAMTISLPVLTIMANLVGILGGFIIAVIYLDLSPIVFFNRAVSVMTLSFWWQSVLKSILFSWLIVLIGAHFGFNVKGGAEGVGKATTASVVAAIFAVIITDALLSIVFYFDF